MGPRGLALVGTISCCVGLAAPAGASAAISVTASGSSLSATGTASGKVIAGTVNLSSNSPIFLVAASGVTSSSPSCTPTTQGNLSGVQCTRPSPNQALPFTAISVDLSGSSADLDVLYQYPLAGCTFDLTLGSGNDKLRLSPAGLSVGVTVAGGDGDDELSGSDGPDTINGQAGDDRLTGLYGTDTLNGGDGNDMFPAESTIDGNDTIDGGSDSPDSDSSEIAGDTIDYMQRYNAVTVALPDDSVGVPAGSNGGTGEADKLAHIENVIGSDNTNNLTGNDRDNFLVGGAQADTLTGGAGNDDLEGYSGADTLAGGDGDDYLDGWDGSDSLTGGDGDDLLQTREGEAENDIDSKVDCGADSDYSIRDSADPAPIGCETDAPGFKGGPPVSGTLRPGYRLTASLPAMWGQALTTTFNWYTVDPNTDEEKLFATGPSVMLGTEHVGYLIEVEVVASDGIRTYSAWNITKSKVPAGTAPTPTPPAPPVVAAGLPMLTTATGVLGAGTLQLAIERLRGDAMFFVSKTGTEKTITYKRGTTVKLFAVACVTPCTVQSTTVLTIKPKNRRKSRRKKTRRVTVSKSAAVPTSGQSLAVTSLRLKSSIARLVKQSKSTSMTTTIVVAGLPNRRGQAEIVTRTQKLRVK